MSQNQPTGTHSNGPSPLCIGDFCGHSAHNGPTDALADIDFEILLASRAKAARDRQIGPQQLMIRQIGQDGTQKIADGQSEFQIVQ